MEQISANFKKYLTENHKVVFYTHGRAILSVINSNMFIRKTIVTFLILLFQTQIIISQKKIKQLIQKNIIMLLPLTEKL